MSDILTKGNVVVNKIKVGDVHYEFEYGCGIECKVLTLPTQINKNQWIWKSVNTKTNREIEYLVTEGMSHYAPNLYDYKAYSVNKWI